MLITPGALYIRYCHACQMDSEFDLWVENTISPPITTHLSEVEVIFIPPYLSLSQYFPQRGREKDNFEKSRKAKQHFHVVDQWPSFSAFSPFHFWEQEALISTYMHFYTFPELLSLEVHTEETGPQWICQARQASWWGSSSSPQEKLVSSLEINIVHTFNWF